MLFFKFISNLSFKAIYILSDFLVFLLFYVLKYRKKVVLINLKNSFPEKSQKEINTIAKGFYKNLTDVALETVKLLSMSENDLKARFEVTNTQIVNDLLEKYGTVLLVTSHVCNWEWKGQLAHLTFDNSGEAIYKPLSNIFFDNLMLKIRSKFGLIPIQMKQILREMIKRKNKKRVIGIIADQVPEMPETAFWTNFLNQDTPFFNGTEKLAKSFNYPVVYLAIERLDRGKYFVNFELLAEPQFKQFEENEITKLYAERLEKAIIANPSDWLWSHRRWKHKRK